jgi:hypothetical protein
MKILLAILATGVVLAPIPASALNPNECARLMRQIYHYRGLEERAEALGHAEYEARMGMQADLFQERYDMKCDGFSEDDRIVAQAMADFAKALKYGAIAAAKFFSMGAM